jgi:hypothetical protein
MIEHIVEIVAALVYVILGCRYTGKRMNPFGW